MKYIFFTYNLLTLCRAVQYSNIKYGQFNTKIIYSDFVSKIPSKLQQDYDIEYIESKSLNNGTKGLALILKTCAVTRKIWNKINELILKSNDSVTLILFRDNEVQELTWINKAYKKYGDDIHFWLMEEGAGLYAIERVPIRYKVIKKIIYTVMRVSKDSLKNLNQGMNKKIEKVICAKPDEFKNKRDDIQIEKMINVFDSDFNNYFVSAVAGELNIIRKYDYVFLTQPLHDFKGDYDNLLLRYNVLLPKIFTILNRRGTTAIKMHPRDTYDYSIYRSENIEILDKSIQQIPFECLMQVCGNPQMISMFSSCSINNQTNKQSIYLGELFEIPLISELFDEKFYVKNNITSCKTIKEFEMSLYDKKEIKNV
ncbi:hypothetical protein MKA58_04625 [[Clostridium] innocuum]|nr:hypothetical protein [[Clostridium] innocuum]